MPSLLYKLHNAAAERFRFVQFPKEQIIPAKSAPPFFKHQMPIWKRAALFTGGLVLILLSLPFIALGVLLLCAVGSVVFSSGR
jgi:hypothetical protein